MKNLIKALFIAGIILAAPISGQAQKIAHIALDSLIQLMPETKKAQDMAQNYLKELEKTIASMQTELETKYNDYISNQASYSDLVKKTKEEELQMLNKRIEDFRMQAQQDYQRKYQELSKPIYDKANNAINTVAKESGYKYVLDTSTGMVLYSESADDILNVVKKKLDGMPEVVLPGAAPVNNGAPKTNTAPANNKPSPAKGK
jgi:outer membrane protein